MPPVLRSFQRDSELVSALNEAFGTRTGWVQAVGEVEDVEVSVAGAAGIGGAATRTSAARFTLVQLGGPPGGPYGVLLARASGEGTELLAGKLVRARVVEVTAMVLSAAPNAPAATTTTTTTTTTTATAAAPGLDTKAGSKWGAQAAARARALADSDDGGTEEEGLPERGDLVQHFAFGLCEVVSVDGDKLTIRDLTGTRRIRELRTRHLRIEAPTEQDGRRLFQLVRRE
jgi:hypothetical protein